MQSHFNQAMAARRNKRQNTRDRNGAYQNEVRYKNFWRRFYRKKFDRKYSVVLVLEQGRTESTFSFVSYIL
jgi:hypothetical protein